VLIALIDYGLGNLRSVQKAFEHLGVPVAVTQDPNHIRRARKLILPGVGAFSAGMQGLRQRGLIEPIVQAARNSVPFLGICLGMQLLFDESEEVSQGFQPEKGLGLIPGRVVRLQGKDLTIPHMGWNQIQPVRDSALLRGLSPGAYAYFVHSYICQPTNPEAIVAVTDYGGNFASVVELGTIWGIQLHPEKSQRVGLNILQNFINY
jgi:imidazole glycerol phosphate synthase, glutamine amidotransferase subunit